MKRRSLVRIGGVLALLAGLGFALLKWQERPIRVLPPIDHILVRKAARSMTVYANGRAVHTIHGVALGNAPVGTKQFEGDERTPEGRYRIDLRNPRSSYHLSLRISYPDEAAIAYAQKAGRSPGGDIYIHGQPNWLPAGRLPGDWTDGCIAIDNRQIEALWRSVEQGTTIEILP